MRFLLPLLLAGIVSQQPETLSLLEEPLYAPTLPKAERARLEGEIAEARTAVAKDPASPDAALRLARAQRELGHVGEALETLTRAIEGQADAPALRLERGRGFILIRKFELAQREFRKAAETLPAAHCDIGFALYLLADYKQSQQEYGQCADAGLFGYLAARRAGARTGPRPELPSDPAPRTPEIRLPGSSAPQAPKQTASMSASYADAIDQLAAGNKTAAKALLERIVEKRKDRWMEPVYVAAENDYARIVKAEPKKGKKKKKK